MTPSPGSAGRPLLLLLLTLACSHSEPFDEGNRQLDQLFAGGEPARLTFGDGVGEPGWLPDGSGLVYAGSTLTGVVPDRCLFQIPATGGTVRRETCDAAPLADIVDSYAYPAPSADRIAFYYQNAVLGIAPTVAGVYAAPLAAPVASAPVRSLPYLAPDGVFYIAASHVSWLGPDEILFIAYSEKTVNPCPGCDPVRVVFPLALLRGPAVPGAPFAAVPGIVFPTSAVRGATADEIYFTLANDSRIHHLVLSTGAQRVIWDFGPDGIARDLTVAGGRLAAVVGGKVQVWLEPEGPLQTLDEGGHLHLLDLGTGDQRRLSGNDRWFRHPALSPDGSALAAEGYAVTIDQDPNAPPDMPVLDTIVNPRGDLWLYGSP